MPTDFTTRGGAKQPRDFLDAALRADKSVSLDVLLPLAQQMPPGDYPDSIDFKPTLAQRRRLAVLEFYHPLLLWTARACEVAKYEAPWPDNSAPLSDHVGRYLLHIRGKWSVTTWGTFHMRRRKLSPREMMRYEAYVADYVNDQLGIGAYRSDSEAPQLLRRACGLPSFLPTKTETCK